MFTVLFATIGSFIEEISGSIIKFETVHKKESIYTAAFINLCFAVIVFTVLALVRDSFVFAAASLPTFIPRVLLEIVQLQVTMWAIMKADRSTYAFVRNLTIPVLLMVDLFLGFSVGLWQWFGIGVILLVVVIALTKHIIKTGGIGFALFTALNAVITISLFKYNVTNFNSVEGEQIVVTLILLVYFFFASLLVARENPFKFLVHKIFLGQGASHGVASALEAFAISLGNPSIAMAAKRAAAVLAGIISGRHYFFETHFMIKIVMGLALAGGLVLLV
ncbi:MAG: hypothetical protein Q8O87_02270 [bacterium]|nr:hypothetical protein [bacterium]